jgi:hypothetical protein
MRARTKYEAQITTIPTIVYSKDSGNSCVRRATGKNNAAKTTDNTMGKMIQGPVYILFIDHTSSIWQKGLRLTIPS